MVESRTTGGPARTKRRGRQRADGTVAIVGIAATLIGSLLSARIASDASLDAVQAQIAATAAKDDRDKLSQVYSEYLKAIDAYVSAAQNRRYAGDVRSVPAPAAEGGVGVSVSPAAYDRYEAARSAMQGRANDLIAFGSDQAQEASAALIATLPVLFAQGRQPGEGLVYDTAKYADAYGSFQRLYCREVARGDSPDCADEIPG